MLGERVDAEFVKVRARHVAIAAAQLGAVAKAAGPSIALRKEGAGSWDESKHPRAEGGRFGEGGGGAGSEGAAEHLGQRLAMSGGFTWAPGPGTPTTGFMVSTDPKEGHGQVIELSNTAKEALGHAIRDWVARELPFVKANDEHYLGGWVDTSGPKPTLYLDVSQRFTDQDKAVAAGRERNQIAIWHLDKGEALDTGGTGH